MVEPWCCRLVPALVSVVLLAFMPRPAAAIEDGDRAIQILGWVEHAVLVEPGYSVRAKLDTGARTSSLDARVIKRFRQYGKRWIRFAVTDPDSGEETILVRERQRTIGIVQHEGDNDVRPTVKIEVCVAGSFRRIEVSLTDRSNFNYPLLLGRRALQQFALVDPGETFLADAACPPGVIPDPLFDPADERPVRDPADDGDPA